MTVPRAVMKIDPDGLDRPSGAHKQPWTCAVSDAVKAKNSESGEREEIPTIMGACRTAG